MPTDPHKQELQDLFEKLPKAYGNKESESDIRLINYSLFESIVGQMMDKAYYHGQISAVEDVEDIIQTTFK